MILVRIFLISRAAFALETDQFTTPKGPLYDIGPELSRKIVQIIEAGDKGQDPDQILYRWVGRNILTSRLSKWVKKTRVEEAPVTFRPGPFRSIYSVAVSPLPATFFFDSPTVHVHGHYLGSDKIDHFFQQGHQYFQRVVKLQERGAGAEASVASAVALGVRQEHNHFGTLATGVYSNGDLAANFAGMKFYMNLKSSVRVGDEVRPPMFERTNDGWRLRAGISRDQLLEPFISSHLDESLNPSRYRFNRRSIRSHVRARCGSWMSFYADRLNLVAPSGQNFAAKWFGEDYGHWLPPAEEISIATECDVTRAPMLTAQLQRKNPGSSRGRKWRLRRN
ncbi:MAG: hypothetical protein JST93_02690 [Acidobacteria bacterium]|nr:hypothetical protein [Acidobacteriota bacterium]